MVDFRCCHCCCSVNHFINGEPAIDQGGFDKSCKVVAQRVVLDAGYWILDAGYWMLDIRRFCFFGSWILVLVFLILLYEDYD